MLIKDNTVQYIVYFTVQVHACSKDCNLRICDICDICHIVSQTGGFVGVQVVCWVCILSLYRNEIVAHHIKPPIKPHPQAQLELSPQRQPEENNGTWQTWSQQIMCCETSNITWADSTKHICAPDNRGWTCLGLWLKKNNRVNKVISDSFCSEWIPHITTHNTINSTSNQIEVNSWHKRNIVQQCLLFWW